MQYKIQNSVGVSNEIYSNTTTTSLHGSGRGTGHVGTNWIFTSVSMMIVLERNYNELYITSPNNKMKLTKHILVFEDDKHQYANDLNNSSILIVLPKLYQVA